MHDEANLCDEFADLRHELMDVRHGIHHRPGSVAGIGHLLAQEMDNRPQDLLTAGHTSGIASSWLVIRSAENAFGGVSFRHPARRFLES